MNPNPEILRKVRVWLDYADEDLRLAIHGMTIIEPCPYRLVAYHAQQCVEKLLKAYLIYQCVDFPYTHNISTLLELTGKTTDWPISLSEAEILTPYAVSTRYPGEDEPVSRQEAENAIAIAEQARKIVRARI